MQTNRWDDNYKREFCSEQVRILFLALYNTVNELGAKASALQKRNVTSHMIEIVRYGNFLTMLERFLVVGWFLMYRVTGSG